ncbi:MAG: ORF6N domain-containing protein [Ruminococcus sp.]|nr:ORF6N domain-containing protein [Ruminococcus sp.]
MYELINNTPLPIREYSGQRVVTFRDIDTLHHRPDGTAGRNFRTNKKYFIENVDYFTINQPDEIRRLGIERQQGGTPELITLVTESGYLMIVKSFKDDLAWAVQRQLVNSYFRVRKQDNIYFDLLQRQNELESRLELLENKSGIRLPVKSSLQNRQTNAAYIMKRLEQDGGTVFAKYQILRLCRKLRANAITEALKLLADNGYIYYWKEFHPRGKPSEMIEIKKNLEN